MSLLVYLRRQGGLELSLAIMVANRSRRTVFLWGLCASLAALFGIGMIDSLEVLTGISGDVAGWLRTLLFAVGAAGILVLMMNALRTSTPTLEDEWNLKETAGRLSISATPAVPHLSDLPGVSRSETRRPPRPGR